MPITPAETKLHTQTRPHGSRFRTPLTPWQAACPVTQSPHPCGEVAGRDTICIHRHLCTPVPNCRHTNTDTKTWADTRTLRDGPYAPTALRMHRDANLERERVTDAPGDTRRPTHRQIQTETCRYSSLRQTRTYTNTQTGTHTPPLPIFLAQLHEEKLLEKKNNVRARGGGEEAGNPRVPVGRPP